MDLNSGVNYLMLTIHHNTSDTVSRNRSLLKEARLVSMLANAELMEEDGFGPKVYRLADGNVLKLFRIKRLLSSNLWSPYACRFVENALRLRTRGFRCFTPLEWGDVPSLDRQYALYEYLSGETVRTLLYEKMTKGRDASTLVMEVGNLLGMLHRKGVYFRSVHLANLVKGSGDREIGLIDVMAMRFHRRRLSLRQRRRNFVHLLRYRQDCRFLEESENRWREGYELGWDAGMGDHEWRTLVGR